MGAGDLELVDMEELPDQLLRAWWERDLKLFKKILQDGCSVNFVYTEELFQPILGVLSRDSSNDVKEYAVAVLNKNANKNERYQSGKCPLHHAAEAANLGMLQALIDAKADVNIGDDSGGTALHCLVQNNWKKSEYKQCMELLLSQPDIDVNIISLRGFSPMRLALHMKNKEAVKCMLEHEKERNIIDFDQEKRRNRTIREEIMNQYPDLEDMLPKYAGPEWSHIKMDFNKLFQLLIDDEIDRFCQSFAKEMEDKTQNRLLRERKGDYTFLQYACKENILPVVEIVLEKGGDPNYTCDLQESPIHIAARCGFSTILKKLLQYSTYKTPNWQTHTSPLHSVAKYARNSEKHIECLSLLLEKRWNINGVTEKFDINAKDFHGNTPLYYATLYNDDITTAILLKNGAYIGVVNKHGESPITKLNPKVLENFLDERMDLKPTHEYETEMLSFDFAFLKPLSTHHVEDEEKVPLDDKAHRGTLEPETTPLLEIARARDLRQLVTHPILTCFTYLKWQRIKSFFYTNLLFYLTFCLILTGYILFANNFRSVPEKFDQNSISPNQYDKPGLHDKTNLTKPHEIEKPATDLIVLIIRAIILIFILLLAIRELFQLIVSPKKYLTSPENYLELFLIIASAFLIIQNCGQTYNPTNKLHYICPQVNAIVILISWIELVLLIGKHPQFSVQVEMFKTVSLSFIHFLSWYILLIIAFALSFYVLFHGCTGECGNNPFTSEGNSLFKTLVMLTGEFEAGEIPFIAYIGTSHIIFTMFVFLIAIVLLNLLNGLAVADTKVIKDDAYLYSCIARIELIIFFENIFLGETLSFVKRLGPIARPILQIFKYFSKKLPLFNGFLPNDGRKEFNTSEKTSIDAATVRRAKEIFALKETAPKDDEKINLNATNEKIQQLASRLLEFEKRFEAIEQSNKLIENLLIRNMAIVGLNNANNENQ